MAGICWPKLLTNLSAHTFIQEHSRKTNQFFPEKNYNVSNPAFYVAALVGHGIVQTRIGRCYLLFSSMPENSYKKHVDSALSCLKIVPHPNPLPGWEGALLYCSHKEKGGWRRGEAQESEKILLHGSMQNPNRTLLTWTIKELNKSEPVLMCKSCNSNINPPHRQDSEVPSQRILPFTQTTGNQGLW